MRNEHDVVIAGGGPTGMMLAGELALAGVDAVVVERRVDQEVDGSRAGGLHARTLEVLDQRGIAERFVAEGRRHDKFPYAQTLLDLGALPSRHPYVLALWQRHIERILAAWLDELDVRWRRGCEVTGLTQDGDGVDVEVDGGPALRCRYLVGCDGGRSVVRRSAGIDFSGTEASTSWMIAQVEMDGEPELGFRHDALGTHAISRREEGEPLGLVLTEPDPHRSGTPDVEDLRSLLVTVYGTDFGLRRATWISRFTDAARQAETYRSGRVLLAGDAAHVHPPHGGQGLNLGVQDAVNLGWKLAQVVDGRSADPWLDSYQAERHPVGARVIRTVLAGVVLALPDARHQAMRETAAELFDLRRVAELLTGLDIRYDLGGGHPLVGRRMPDLDLLVAGEPKRAYELLHPARPVLLDLTSRESDLTGRAPGVAGAEVVAATSPGHPDEAILIRPDGHVAWAGDPADPHLGRTVAASLGWTA